MRVSEYWDTGLRGAIVACSLAAPFFPVSELAIGSQSSLAMLSGILLAVYVPLPFCALAALIAPFVSRLKPHAALLDALTALFAFVCLVALVIYAILAGVGFIALFFLLMTFFIPVFWGMGLFVQAGSWLLGITFVLAMVQMVRSNRTAAASPAEIQDLPVR